MAKTLVCGDSIALGVQDPVCKSSTYTDIDTLCVMLEPKNNNQLRQHHPKVLSTPFGSSGNGFNGHEGHQHLQWNVPLAAFPA